MIVLRFREIFGLTKCKQDEGAMNIVPSSTFRGIAKDVVSDLGSCQGATKHVGV